RQLRPRPEPGDVGHHGGDYGLYGRHRRARRFRHQRHRASAVEVRPGEDVREQVASGKWLVVSGKTCHLPLATGHFPTSNAAEVIPGSGGGSQRKATRQHNGTRDLGLGTREAALNPPSPAPTPDPPVPALPPAGPPPTA